MTTGIPQVRLSPVVLVLMLLIGALYAGQWLWPSLTHSGVLYGPAVASGQWWRPVSSGFLHGSVFHLGFNLFFLYVLGPQLEALLGSARFALLYMVSLLSGSAAVLLFDWQQPTLGASGAVLGLAGALAVATVMAGARLTQTPFFGLVVLNLALPLIIPSISFWGHAGGVLGGVVSAFLLLRWRTGNGHQH